MIPTCPTCFVNCKNCTYVTILINNIKLFKIHIDNLFLKPGQSKLQVISLHGDSLQLVCLIELLQANPVLLVNGRILQVHNLIRLAISVEFEPFTLFWFDNRLVEELDQNQIAKLEKIGFVSFIASFPIIVDVC